MRDLDKRAILTGDFIIIYGDVVTNMNMDKALAEHRARRAVDKNAIMTMVLRQIEPRHGSQPDDMLPVFVVDPAKQRCVHYEQITTKGSGRHPHIDQDLLYRDLDVHVDLLDCGVDICTPDVLALWSDNFDYEAPRKGFLHSVLKDYELNGKTIHTHILNQGYAARVRNLQAYDTISRDVLTRWAFPLAPDVNWDGVSHYKRVQDNVYLDRDVKVARSSRLGANVVIGEKSTVGARTVISNSTIGRGCQIGAGCKIINAHVWAHVSITDGADVRGATIDAGARIGRKSVIQRGVLISSKVHVQDGAVIKQRRRLVRKRDDQKGPLSDDDYEEWPRDQQDVLQNGMGSLFINSASNANADEQQNCYDLRHHKSQSPHLLQRHPLTKTFRSITATVSCPRHLTTVMVRLRPKLLSSRLRIASTTHSSNRRTFPPSNLNSKVCEWLQMHPSIMFDVPWCLDFCATSLTRKKQADRLRMSLLQTIHS